MTMTGDESLLGLQNEMKIQDFQNPFDPTDMTPVNPQIKGKLKVNRDHFLQPPFYRPFFRPLYLIEGRFSKKRDFYLLYFIEGRFPKNTGN